MTDESCLPKNDIQEHSRMTQMPIRRNLLVEGSAVQVHLVGAASIATRETGSVTDHDLDVAKPNRVSTATRRVVDMIREASTAPNGQKTDLWRLRQTGVQIVIPPDLAGRTPAEDLDNFHRSVSPG
jgi:hypothetical protein